MLELGAVFAIVYAIEEMARARRLKYKIWCSTAILGWLLTDLSRLLTPFPLAFAVIGWLFLIAIFLFLYSHKLPPKKKLSASELSKLFNNVELEHSPDRNP